MSDPVFTLDAHVDIRWPNPPDPRLEGPMRVDFPKMERGGLRAGVYYMQLISGAAMQVVRAVLL